jgi:hypothetical protein
MLTTARRVSLLIVALMAAQTQLVLAQGSGSSGSKSFSLSAEDNQYNPGPSYPDPVAYPTPHMVQQPAHVAPKPPAQHHPPMKAAVQQTAAPPPMQASAAVDTRPAPPPGVLPQSIMGRWLVLGSRGNVQARPEFQSGIDNIFTMSNSQTWEIGGQPGAYSMNSSSGVSQVQVGQCTATTAYIRYQHQIKNTMAQEAIVMQVSPDGRSFQGMQRISIVKPGEGQPRAVVTYQLMGQRQ